MKFIACSAIVLLSFMTPRVLSESEGPSTSRFLLDFASVFSGSYTDAKEVENEKAHNDKLKHDELQTSFLPADIPALRPDFAFYFLETINGQLLRKQILTISKNDEGIIVMKPYNVTDRSRFGIKLPDPDDLASIKTEDLASPREECIIEVVKVSRNVFSGEWPDCGVSMSYGVTITCDSMSGSVTWESAPEHANPVPYVFEKYKSFPLPDYWTKDAADWKSPCLEI